MLLVGKAGAARGGSVARDGQLDSLDDGVFRAMNDRDVPKNRLGYADLPGVARRASGERPQLGDARYRPCCSAAGLI